MERQAGAGIFSPLNDADSDIPKLLFHQGLMLRAAMERPGPRDP